MALKNQYNHIKKDLENKIDEVNEFRMLEKKAAVDLKSQYEKNNARLKDITEEIVTKE